jgi:hypothetical protein
MVLFIHEGLAGQISGKVLMTDVTDMLRLKPKNIIQKTALTVRIYVMIMLLYTPLRFESILFEECFRLATPTIHSIPMRLFLSTKFLTGRRYKTRQTISLTVSQFLRCLNRFRD